MNLDFWLAKWRKNEIGFHQDRVNTKLKDFIENHSKVKYGIALVPLCGKSLDMIYLSQKGYEVLGVELSEKAIRDFLQENNLSSFKEDKWNGFKVFRCNKSITLLCGDFFKLHPKDIQTEKPILCYDRASLIALPEKQRISYTDHLRGLLPRGSEVFSIVIEYPQSEMEGPPFSVSPEELQKLFLKNFKIESLHRVNIEKEKRGGKFQELSYLREYSFIMRKI